MAFKDFMKFVFNKKESRGGNWSIAAVLGDTNPVFSQFGEDVYSSDVVQNCIDVIAKECSKLLPQHIRIDPNGVQTKPKSSINSLFRVAPNDLMTTSSFIEKTIWLLFLNYNAIIYPMYKIYTDARGKARKEFTGFYPLNPTEIQFEQDPTGTMFVRMWFEGGQDFTVRYDSVVHLRLKYSINELMGGGEDGQPDNSALLNAVETNDTIIQGVGKAVKAGLSIRGILKTNTILNSTDQATERERLEEAMADAESAIVPMDLKSEYIPITSNPAILEEEVLKFVQDKILNWYGVSLPILSGDFTAEQYEAFYEKTLEPLLIMLGQAFTKTLFSQREIDVGNVIVFYRKNMMYLSTKTKLDIIKITGEQGLLTNDQKLMLLGYPPIGGEEGKKRTQSLNFVDTELVNQYQSARSTAPQLQGEKNNMDDEGGNDIDNGEE